MENDILNKQIVEMHLPCPSCGSHDALTTYADGHSYCFSCKATTFPKEDKEGGTVTSAPSCVFIQGHLQALKARGITLATCSKYGYVTGSYQGKPCHIANYYDEYGKLKGQKLRFQDKTFKAIGSTTGTFYGQQLFSKGKRLIITEGEIDCLTVSQIYGNIACVVSIPTGAGSAKKTFEKNLEWLNNFDEVVVAFDSDKAGIEAIESIQGILPSEKLKVARLQHYKDPNEYLMANEGDKLVNAIDNAKPYSPSNIINGSELWEMLKEEPEEVRGYSLPWAIEADTMIKGIRKGEITLVTAGTGIGKSTFVREILYHLGVHQHMKVGIMMLEENTRRTAKGIIGIHLNKPIHISRAEVTDREYKQAFDDTLGKGLFVLYNHFGSLETDKLLNAMRYMAISERCDFLILDHVSIATSGIEAKNETKMIDVLMTRLRSLVEETGTGMVAICHLKRTEDKKAHEEGGHVSLNHLRGSQSLAQLSDTIIALERNQQSEKDRDVMGVRILKCRHTGNTGLGGFLSFNRETNRLEKYQPPMETYGFDTDNEEDNGGDF